MFPFQVEMVLVENLGKMEEKKGENQEEEEKPGQEEPTTPDSDPVAGKAVTHRRQGGKQGEDSTSENHPVILILHLVRERHRDQGNASDQVTNIKEEEASE